MLQVLYDVVDQQFGFSEKYSKAHISLLLVFICFFLYFFFIFCFFRNHTTGTKNEASGSQKYENYTQVSNTTTVELKKAPEYKQNDPKGYQKQPK